MWQEATALREPTPPHPPSAPSPPLKSAGEMALDERSDHERTTTKLSDDEAQRRRTECDETKRRSSRRLRPPRRRKSFRKPHSDATSYLLFATMASPHVSFTCAWSA